MDHKQKQEEMRSKLAEIRLKKNLTFLQLAQEIGTNVAMPWAFIRRNSNLHVENFYKIDEYIKKQEQGK